MASDPALQTQTDARPGGAPPARWSAVAVRHCLVRRGKRVQPVDSWDTTSLVTLYALVGLSRHADHHAYASRPFQQLRHWEESPKLPRGYPGMIRLVLGNNRKFQGLMTAELERKSLGPFA